MAEEEKTVEELEEEYKKLLMEKIKKMQEETVEEPEEESSKEEIPSEEDETSKEEKPSSGDETEELKKRVQELESQLSQQKTPKYVEAEDDVRKAGIAFLKKAANGNVKITWRGDS